MESMSERMSELVEANASNIDESTNQEITNGENAVRRAVTKMVSFTR